jgi:hypothetical protein
MFRKSYTEFVTDKEIVKFTDTKFDKYKKRLVIVFDNAKEQIHSRIYEEAENGSYSFEYDYSTACMPYNFDYDYEFYSHMLCRMLVPLLREKGYKVTYLKGTKRLHISWDAHEIE